MTAQIILFAVTMAAFSFAYFKFWQVRFAVSTVMSVVMPVCVVFLVVVALMEQNWWALLLWIGLGSLILWVSSSWFRGSWRQEWKGGP